MSGLAPSSREEAVFAYIDGVGNHELKTLVSALAIEKAGSYVTATAIANEVNSLQIAGGVEDGKQSEGVRPVWAFQTVHAIQYFNRSLAPVGAVVKGRARGASGKEVDAWKADSKFISEQEAMAGFLSRWSLRWQDISTQQTYGVTTSKTNIRSPQVRHRIYEALLGSGEHSVASIRDAIGVEYAMDNSLSNQIRALVDVGLIERESKRKDYDPQLKIVDTEYRHVSMKFEDLIAETRATYQAMQKLGTGELLTVNQLIDQAAAIDPTIDTVKLRMLLVHGLDPKSKNYPGLELAEANPMSQESLTRVSLSAAAKEPIAELLEGVNDVLKGNKEQYIKDAKQIISNPDDFRKLVAKASRFSPFRNGHYNGRQKLEAQVQSTVDGLGVATVAEVRQYLIDSYGRKLTNSFVRKILHDLAAKGLIYQTETTQHPHSKQSLNLYGTLSS
jgi:hypothetical protein